MSRRLDLQIAVLKILDTLIDVGVVPCHEAQQPDTGLAAMLVAARNFNIGPVPKGYPDIAAEFREWNRAKARWAECQAPHCDRSDPIRVTPSEIQPTLREWGDKMAQRNSGGLDHVDMNPVVPMPTTRVVPFEDKDAMDSMFDAMDAIEATGEGIEDSPPPAGWDAIEGDEPEPPAEHLDAPATTEDGEPAPVCPVLEQPVLMTTKELSKLLGRSTSSLALDAKKGEIPPPITLGGKRYWRRAEIDTWVATGCPPVSATPPVEDEPVIVGGDDNDAV